MIITKDAYYFSPETYELFLAWVKEHNQQHGLGGQARIDFYERSPVAGIKKGLKK